ncbi:MAG: hypothetical protein OXH64_06310 [Rhodospirillaceae bacterium]|nr:hypothetical protein [Rhodospirillaceae bacterium]
MIPGIRHIPKDMLTVPSRGMRVDQQAFDKIDPFSPSSVIGATRSALQMNSAYMNPISGTVILPSITACQKPPVIIAHSSPKSLIVRLPDIQ